MPSILSHHAYLIIGNRHDNLSWLKSEIGKFLGGKLENHPDYLEFSLSSFSVDDSRLLKEKSSGCPVLNDNRFFVLSADSFTSEAQNSLLKLLEEPAVGSHFYIIIDDATKILPTLKSRLETIFILDDNDNYADETKKIINGNIADRFLVVEKFLKAYDGENLTIRLKTKEFLNQVEKISAKKLLSLHGEKRVKLTDFLEELIRLKAYLNDPASSPKLILEHLAMILPATA